MDAELEARKVALLAECRVDSRVFEQVLPRLESFMEPFVDSLVRREQCEHAVKFVCGLLSARAPKRQVGHDEVLVVIRDKDRDDQQVVKTDDYLSNAVADTPLTEFARVAQAEHRIEECLQRAKSEAGLADYEVRNWIGWQHHQTLSLIATWFLIQESRRKKNGHRH